MWSEQGVCKLPGEGWMEFSFPSTMESLCIVADLAMDTVQGFGFHCGMAEEMTQAILEAVGNAIRHGNALDSSKQVTVRFRKEGERVTVTVDDEGDRFEPGNNMSGPEEVLSESGRGLFLMRVYADEVSFQQAPSGGTRVVLVKHGAGEPCSQPSHEDGG